MDIITTVCVDHDRSDNGAQYLMLPRTNSEDRRRIYWSLAATSMATSLRCNPKAKHIVYTNDRQSVNVRDVDIRGWFSRLGVEIRYLPFEKFAFPVTVSRVYRNGLYKPEVIGALAHDPGRSSVIMDSDALWTRPDPRLEEAVRSGKVLVYDIHPGTPPTQPVWGMTRREMGQLFQNIIPGYPTADPVWLGGEFIAGTNQVLRRLATEAERIVKDLRQHPSKLEIRMSNGIRILDGDETMITMICNAGSVPWVDAGQFMRRIWTVRSTPTQDEVNATVWHLPYEKKIGFPLLFKEVMNRGSKFWTIPLVEFKEYLGGFVGVPRRKRFSISYFDAELRNRLRSAVKGLRTRVRT